MSAMGRKRTFAECPEWVESGHWKWSHAQSFAAAGGATAFHSRSEIGGTCAPAFDKRRGPTTGLHASAHVWFNQFISKEERNLTGKANSNLRMQVALCSVTPPNCLAPIHQRAVRIQARKWGRIRRAARTVPRA